MSQQPVISTGLSVIIPTLNEAEALPRLLAALREQQDIDLEVIVADGGSQDGSQSIAQGYGAQVVVSPTGRGRQMNQGARQATQPLLLFLHADSGLTSAHQLASSITALTQAQTQAGHDRVAGHCKLCFRRTTGGHSFAYHYYEEKSALNRPECTNGDQGLLLTHRFFSKLGGFDESLGFLEDQRLAERVRRQGLWITLPKVLETSARRFESEGLGRRMLLSAMIMACNHLGLDVFFQRLKIAYQVQDQTSRLRLTPMFEVFDALNREARPQVRRTRWLALGRYVQSHLWQPLFCCDLLLERAFAIHKRPLLWLHDRVIRPLTDFLPFHLLSTVLVWLVYVGLRSYFRHNEE